MHVIYSDGNKWFDLIELINLILIVENTYLNLNSSKRGFNTESDWKSPKI